MSDLLLAQTKESPAGAPRREGQLRGVVESARHEVGVIDEARLNGLGCRDPEHQVAAATVRVFGGGQDRSEIVRRMAGLGRGEEVVHETDVAHQCGVPECRVDGICWPAADQRARASAAEFRDLLTTGDIFQDVDWTDQLGLRVKVSSENLWGKYIFVSFQFVLLLGP